MTRNALATLVLVALAGCSSTHLTVEDDSGIIVSIDAGVRPTQDAFVPPGADARLPGVDTGGTVMDDPDAYVPPTMGVDAWSPPMTGDDAGGTSTVDAGPAGVTCGSETCTDPEICCVSFGGGPGGGGMSSMMCTAPADCMGVAASCDGPEDCAAGEACCGMRTMGGGSTGCVPDAMCRFGRLCHADADCTGRDTCCAIMGTSICSPFCP